MSRWASRSGAVPEVNSACTELDGVEMTSRPAGADRVSDVRPAPTGADRQDDEEQLFSGMTEPPRLVARMVGR